MTNKIFFCGEVVADLFEKQGEPGNFTAFLGGSHFNSAVGGRKAVLRENLGFDVGFVGSLSKDLFGSRFYQAMEDQGVDTSGIVRVDRNTTLAIVSIQPGKENAFSFYCRDTAEQMTRIEDLPVRMGQEDDNVILCFGSISTVIEPARFAWLEFAKRQKDKALLFYDLNTRPSITKDADLYREIVMEWAKTVHVMKASDADIAWTYPDMSMREIANIWLEAGALMVVFTKGAHGAEAYTNTTSANVETLDLVAPNTVGAGDNFNAGLAIALAKMGVFTVHAIEALSAADMSNLLHGANNTAANHLISNGAKSRHNIETAA